MDRWKILLHVSYDRVFQTPAMGKYFAGQFPRKSFRLTPEVLRAPGNGRRAVTISEGGIFRLCSQSCASMPMCPPQFPQFRR